MAVPVDFPGANLTLGPPKGMTEEEVRSMPVHHAKNHFISCWYLSDSEIEEIVRTRCVWQTLMGSGAQPSFISGSLNDVIDLVYDQNEAI
jgi:hypothetical protein